MVTGQINGECKILRIYFYQIQRPQVVTILLKEIVSNAEFLNVVNSRSRGGSKMEYESLVLNIQTLHGSS